MSQKETYYAPDSIRSKSREILSSVAGIPHERLIFKPAHSALLVLDMQGYFLNPSSHAFIPSAPAILPGVNALIRCYTRHHLPVFVTRHLNTSEDAGLMATWWRDLVRAEDPLSTLDSRLEQGIGLEIQKTRYDAFFNSPLEELLHEQHVSQVVICGVMTHLCCETTARSAFMRGFEVFFTVDGTATYTEAFHRASLLNLSHGFAVPVLVENILEKLDG